MLLEHCKTWNRLALVNTDHKWQKPPECSFFVRKLSSPYQGKSLVFTDNHTPLSISDIETINRLGEIALSGRQTFEICILDIDKIRKDPTWVYQLQGLPPIITMATGLDSIAYLCYGQSPFRWPYLRLPFSASPMPALDEGCLIATQWGCPRRRVCYSPS
ncbi:hypothetical protein LguiA_036021 [Lonicera macranthoides]